MSSYMVNFGLLTAEICWRVGTPANFNGFRVLAALLHGTGSGRQPNFAALNRGRHLYLAGRPSRWALAHFLILNFVCYFAPQGERSIAISVSSSTLVALYTTHTYATHGLKIMQTWKNTEYRYRHHIPTRAQQLLRWATVWRHTHGPNIGGGCYASLGSWVPI